MDNLNEVVRTELDTVFAGLKHRESAEDNIEIYENNVTGKYGIALRMDWALAQGVKEDVDGLILNQATHDIADLIVNGNMNGTSKDALLRAMDGEKVRKKTCDTFVVNSMTYETSPKETMYDYTMYINFTATFK